MFSPYDFQQAAINSVFKFFIDNKGKGNPLVVAPTGSGKSVIIACFCQQVIDRWKTQKILVISHVKEILGQNYSAIAKQLNNKKIGLYSAGMKSKTIGQVTVAGIQSIYNKPELFDQFDIILVDECHTVQHRKGGMYHKFFSQVKKNVIGFTATPYRLGAGYLHLGKGAFFSDICFTIPISMLQKKGYLCELTSKKPENMMDADGIKKQGGDFIISELSKAFDRDRITRDIIAELVPFKNIRKKWLLFAIDIKHAENITDLMNAVGIKTAAVHSKMEGNRETIIQDFKDGKYQCLVSVAVLTTGFDVPSVDLIGLLRPTSSPTLHVQIIGRGLRVSPDKKDCLVLDFAGNLFRNGPINAPLIKISGDGSGEPIMKACENCAEIVHAAVRVCPKCHTEFKFRHHLSAKAKEESIVTLEDWHTVDSVNYFYHVGTKNIPMLKVIYKCGIRSFSEHVCFEHGGYATQRARRWWERRSPKEVPYNVHQAMDGVDTLRRPKRILVNEGGQYDEIKEQEF